MMYGSKWVLVCILYSCHFVWHLFLAMAFADVKPRIKALQSVTAHALEKAIEVGFQTLGHRNIKVLCTSLDEITWKTAASKHIASFLALFPLLFQLFLVCKNGLVPAALLEKAGSVD